MAGQLALAWVHHQGDDVFPIPGTKKLKYLQENIAAFDIKLSKEELTELEAAVPRDAVSLKPDLLLSPCLSSAHCCEPVSSVQAPAVIPRWCQELLPVYNGIMALQLHDCASSSMQLMWRLEKAQTATCTA